MSSTERSPAVPATTVGILYPGEMGSTLGRLLVDRGLRVVTTLDGRSERSGRLCREAGLTVLGSLAEVVKESDILVSVVSPAAATGVARRVAAELPGRTRRMVYVDLNSIAPLTMATIETTLDDPNVDLVDAAIHGLASRLSTHGTVYLSGPAAPEVAALIGAPPRSVLLGDEIGRASLMKMLIGGVNKGLVALMVELSEAAAAAGVLDAFWAICRASYPGVMEPFERLLPTYPQHAARRGEEMAELERTVAATGGRPAMATAARTVLERAAESPASLGTLVERLAAIGPTTR